MTLFSFTREGFSFLSTRRCPDGEREGCTVAFLAATVPDECDVGEFSPRSLNFGFALGRMVRMIVASTGVCVPFVMTLMYSAISAQVGLRGCLNSSPLLTAFRQASRRDMARLSRKSRMRASLDFLFDYSGASSSTISAVTGKWSDEARPLRKSLIVPWDSTRTRLFTKMKSIGFLLVRSLRFTRKS